jgi:lipid II:glycine glycyltransferase (peptidoglycan interpeptide bridge formation enzyme)
LAQLAGEIIAGAIFLIFNNQVVFKYGASDSRYQHLRANNLVMWEAIRRSIANGYRNLCLGRTEPENKGLLQFKRGWGTVEETLPYYKYDFRRNTFVQDSAKISRFHTRAFGAMPIPILKVAGNLLYKHVG